MDQHSQTDIKTDEMIINDSIGISENDTDANDITSFLNSAIFKSKILNRNKLQIELEKCLDDINKYKTDNIHNKNLIDQLTRDKNTYMESNEKNKNEVQRLNVLTNTLNQQINTHLGALNYEKNMNTNLKVAHDVQIQKYTTLNEQLNIKLNEYIIDQNDLQLKYNELQKRYTDLTTLYSEQNNKFELYKKNIKHVNDELNTALSNNTILHDEITANKTQISQYLQKIDELKNTITLERETQKELNMLSYKISSDAKHVTNLNSDIQKSRITTNARGLRVTNR